MGESLDYYVYEWFIKDTNEVFYVGKGKGRRYKNITHRNKFFKDMYNTHDCDVRIVKNNLDEQTAFEEEKKLILFYRENTSYRLTNQTDGGDGTSGWKVPDEFRQKQSQIHKLQWEDQNFRNKMLQIRQDANGPYKSQCFRNKISSLVRGKNNPNYNHKWNDEQKEHLSEVRKELKLAKGINNITATKIVCLETGEIFDLISDAQKKYNVKNISSFSVALKYRQKTAAGLHWLTYDKKLENDEDRFRELLISLSQVERNFPIICINTKQIYKDRKTFLKEYKVGIKKFLKRYSQNGYFEYNKMKYMYVKDYLGRFIQ